MDRKVGKEIMKSSEVNIICPCYNGARFLEQFLSCILEQTYNNIILIMVNDGSTDNSLKIMESFREKVEDRGYRYIVKDQKNGGPSAAYNCGLEDVEGDYIMQIDVDDTISPDCIEKMANYLDNNEEYAVVRINGVYHYIDENREDELFTSGYWDLAEQLKEDLCENIVTGKSFLLSGSYMYRRKCFETIYPDRIIYPWKNGQNYQVLLPLTYKFKAAFLNEKLFAYTIRKDSLEHTPITHEQEIKRTEESAFVIYNSLVKAGAPEEYAKKWSAYREHKRKLVFAYQNRDKKNAQFSYNTLKRYNLNTISDFAYYICTQYSILRCLRKITGGVYRRIVK